MRQKLLVGWSIFIALICFIPNFIWGAIPGQEREILISFYNATNGDSWTDNSGWKTPPLHTDGFALPGTEGSWYGISVEGDHVIEINMYNNHLNGTLPSNLENLSQLQSLNCSNYGSPTECLTGSIPASLGNLGNLQTLLLYNNKLSGNIPPELGNLVNLKKLYLSGNQLSGTLPTSFGNLGNLEETRLELNQLSGNIPVELANLSNLRKLGLGYNKFSGAIPPELGNMANLLDLWLSHNLLSGSIPVELANLGNLHELCLENNQLSGSIPPQLENLSNLTALTLSNNKLSGIIPPQLGNLKNLYLLYLYSNQLSGSIPSELGNLTNLIGLTLGENKLTGNIPESFKNLGRLLILNLSHNELSGSIPSELGNLANLVTLSMGGNQLSGEISSSIGNLTKLENFYLSNNQLSGEIPSTLTNLTAIKALDIGYNCLTATDTTLREWLDTHDPDWEAHQDQCGGTTPTITVISPNGGESWVVGSSHSISWASSGTVGNVKIEYTANNGSSWTSIVSSIANSGSYTWITPNTPSSQCKIRISEAADGTPSDISDQAFSIVSASGTIPAQERATLISLYNAANGGGWTNSSGWKTPPLHTDGFAMPGTEGSWYGITVSGGHVTAIKLDRNTLSGGIPPELGNLNNLQNLNVSLNKLSGNIPPQLGNLTNLQELYLGFNQLSGSIPLELGNLGKLKYFALGGNQLSGTIPVVLTGLSALQIFALDGNQLSGGIPPEIGNLANLFSLSLSNNQLSGSIPSQLGYLSNLKYLYLDNNQLGGTIPPQLGNLNKLEDLWLFENRLSGTIPSQLGNLTNLHYFIVSNNQLTGAIPSQLGNLKNLMRLYLDFNKLSGSIPTQLGNLTNLEWFFLQCNHLTGTIPSSFTNLKKITYLDIGYNCLEATDAALRKWLDTHDPDWEAHQDQCGETPTITVIAPNDGDGCAVGFTSDITWSSTGQVGNVKIQYSTDNGSTWKTIISSTSNDGLYSWIVPNTVSSQCKIKISEAADGSPFDISEGVFSIFSPALPAINLNRTRLHYGAVISGNTVTTTGPQQVLIDNGGGGTLEWTAEVDVSWLICTPAFGTLSSIITISVDPTGLTPGNYEGTISISGSNATNSPQTVSVSLTVKTQAQDMAPFGEFSTPLNGSTVSSSIPVTGWVLDDVEVRGVKIYRKDGQSLVFIGDAVFVEGARPDVEATFPDYPFNYNAGWGYMLLTNFLPNQGNGVFELHAIAEDVSGQKTDLGIKTIIVDNANAVKPFGALDTPPQGGNASGKKYANWGWVLTPQPNFIPVDGSTIGVWVDGVKIGRPVYNIYREDIATLFPGYANSNGAVGYFFLDTTSYSNGVHTICWNVTDNAGNTDGIGSRYFTVLNTNNASGSSLEEDKTEKIVDILPDFLPIRVIKGYNEEIFPIEIYPDENGFISVECRELERIELTLKDDPSGSITGYLVVAGEPRPLPIGSTLDTGEGVFYWQPAAGFFGRYHFVFIETTETGASTQKNIIVHIGPRFPIGDLGDQ